MSTSSLILTDAGDVVLSLPGLRGILRPEEGYAHADLLPEAFDSLAPERIAAGTPPNTASDIYACGCVWWHLLCGRPPLAGGNSLAKLRAAQAGEICDVRRYAPDVPPPLAAAISACFEREPSRRPESMARLAAMLGPPTRSGKEALADCLARAGRPTVHWTTTVRSIRRSNRTPLWMAGAVCCLAAVVAISGRFGTDGQASGVRRAATAVAGGSGRRPPGPQSRGVDHDTPLHLTNHHAAVTAMPSRVVPAAYQQVETKPPDLVLAADKPLAVDVAGLAGRPVRPRPSGQSGGGARSRAGLVVDKENVRFENIDFVWRHASAADDAKTAEPAMVQLLASRAEFRGCSFQCEEMGTCPRFRHPLGASGAGRRRGNVAAQRPAPTGPTVCCTASASGLDCRTVGALAIELKNVLHLDAGPLVRLDHCPRSDEPVSIVLSQVTLRGGGPLLECLAAARRATAGRNRRAGDRLCVCARAGRAAGASDGRRIARAAAGRHALERTRLAGDAARADHRLARAGRPRADRRRIVALDRRAGAKRSGVCRRSRRAIRPPAG